MLARLEPPPTQQKNENVMKQGMPQGMPRIYTRENPSSNEPEPNVHRKSVSRSSRAAPCASVRMLCMSACRSVGLPPPSHGCGRSLGGTLTRRNPLGGSHGDKSKVGRDTVGDMNMSSKAVAAKQTSPHCADAVRDWHHCSVAMYSNIIIIIW